MRCPLSRKAPNPRMDCLTPTLPAKAARRPYEKPVVHSEKMFETSALACGKCLSGPVGQYQCMTLGSNS